LQDPGDTVAVVVGTAAGIAVAGIAVVDTAAVGTAAGIAAAAHIGAAPAAERTAGAAPAAAHTAAAPAAAHTAAAPEAAHTAAALAAAHTAAAPVATYIAAAAPVAAHTAAAPAAAHTVGVAAVAVAARQPNLLPVRSSGRNPRHPVPRLHNLNKMPYFSSNIFFFFFFFPVQQDHCQAFNERSCQRGKSLRRDIGSFEGLLAFLLVQISSFYQYHRITIFNFLQWKLTI